MSSLTDLLSRVEEATGADRKLDWRLADFAGHEAFDRDSALWPPFGVGSKVERAIPTYTASLDAALALCERVLPGWWWAVGRYGPDGLVSANVSRDGKKHGADVMAPTPALALISATLRALIAAEESR